ncbi:ficolin-1-like [Clavelina lepadiformis]|uniref:ficolin-1-like n=1 Tax=Clavelina lepadiformis TaxID=159417 RepID=UPI004041DA54
MLTTKFIIFFFIFLTTCEASREVTLTCGGDDVTERGPAGPAGKKGPHGNPGIHGIKGAKGEPGENDGWMEAVENSMERIDALERNDQEKFKPKNCRDIMNNGEVFSGVYSLNISGRLVKVYCDMDTDGGGWMVFQRRIDGNLDFYKTWEFYRRGFGDINKEFWFGLKNLHTITSSGNYELRVDIQDFDYNWAFAKYSSFSVGSEDTNYILSVSGYSGNAGDALAEHNNKAFTTKDEDHDTNNAVNCAVRYHGAWWYRRCHHSNLNGQYLRGGVDDCNGMRWRGSFGRGSCYSLKMVEMKMRPT